MLITDLKTSLHHRMWNNKSKLKSELDEIEKKISNISDTISIWDVFKLRSDLRLQEFIKNKDLKDILDNLWTKILEKWIKIEIIWINDEILTISVEHFRNKVYVVHKIELIKYILVWKKLKEYIELLNLKQAINLEIEILKNDDNFLNNLTNVWIEKFKLLIKRVLNQKKSIK